MDFKRIIPFHYAILGRRLWPVLPVPSYKSLGFPIALPMGGWNIDYGHGRSLDRLARVAKRISYSI